MCPLSKFEQKSILNLTHMEKLANEAIDVDFVKVARDLIYVGFIQIKGDVGYVIRQNFGWLKEST